VIQLDDEELMQIVQTDNEHRGNLYLRKAVGRDPNLIDSGEGNTRSRQKINKFFGVDPSSKGVGKTPAKKRNIVVDPTAIATSISGNLFSAHSPEQRKSKFFGERPPDEVIVDQLEQFFPGINTEKETATADKVKSIVQANLKNKRTSRRVSSLMLRRLTNQLPEATKNRRAARPQAIILTPKDVGLESAITATQTILDPLALVNLGSADLTSTLSTKINEASISGSILAEEPQPISFRWVPGRLIGQGAFGKVFHALNLDTGDFMAVKQVLSGGQESTPQQKKSNDSLQREIELLSELDHDNIVRYFGIIFY
jgi:Protein kinase domain